MLIFTNFNAIFGVLAPFQMSECLDLAELVDGVGSGPWFYVQQSIVNVSFERWCEARGPCKFNRVVLARGTYASSPPTSAGVGAMSITRCKRFVKLQQQQQQQQAVCYIPRSHRIEANEARNGFELSECRLMR